MRSKATRAACKHLLLHNGPTDEPELSSVCDRLLKSLSEPALASGSLSEAVGASLVTDSDDRADHGVFSFFRFSPHQRPQIAAVEADFFARIAAGEGADLMHCYDDQYVCNVGQLVHLALGSYRLIADLRAHLSGPNDAPVVTSKPYDLAAAILVAREAGCVVTAPDGTPLDFPLDATTPVSFVGWANEPTARRLAPHLEAALS